MPRGRSGHVVRAAVVAVVLFWACPASYPHAQADARQFDPAAGVRINYVDRGRGEPVVMLHGLAASLAAWEQPPTIARLVADGFRVVAYDLRGHGASSQPAAAAQYGAADVDDLLRLLDHLSIPSAHLVGYGRGSAIASRFAVRYPDRVKSLVLGGWGVNNAFENQTAERCQASAEAAARGEAPAEVRQDARADGGAQPGRTRPDAAVMAAIVTAECGVPTVTASALDATGHPVLAILGERDPMMLAVSSMSDLMPGLSIIVVSGATHAGAPGRLSFAQAVRRFLEAHRGETR